MTSNQPLRLLELYSGIGGMHVSAKESGIQFQVVGSCEINPTALQVYSHNFSSSIPKPVNIMGFSTQDLDKLSPDLLMMSPPCQPFTRQGLKRDLDDERTSSFIHFLKLLQECRNPPKYILLENVSGFETSRTRELLLETLQKCNYSWQEFLISPLQLGVPNSRLRYYLLARLKPLQFCFEISDQVKSVFPVCTCVRTSDYKMNSQSQCENCSCPVLASVSKLLYKHHFNNLSNTEPITDKLLTDSECNFKTLESNINLSCSELVSPLEKYLVENIEIDNFLLKDKTLTRYGMLLDIVNASSKRSCCFTKGYSHFVEGTGSVLQHNLDVDVDVTFEEANKFEKDDPKRLELLQKLELRYFTPQEVANLMCFPSWYKLPTEITNKQCYRVLGNSINILAVTSLLLILLH
ncbi:unnamed protein product, partial [Meganyctiphanes norvegica]